MCSQSQFQYLKKGTGLHSLAIQLIPWFSSVGLVKTGRDMYCTKAGDENNTVRFIFSCVKECYKSSTVALRVRRRRLK
jgi:hypothetical protein